MKRSQCMFMLDKNEPNVVCGREYWAQTHPAVTSTKHIYGSVPTMEDGKEIIKKVLMQSIVSVVEPSRPKTTLCCKHAPPTMTYGRSAQWRKPNFVRHHHKRSRVNAS